MVILSMIGKNWGYIVRTMSQWRWFGWLVSFVLANMLFLAMLIIPDPIPIVDEAGTGMLALLHWHVQLVRLGALPPPKEDTKLDWPSVSKR
jgi:hypothetical protein